MDMHLASLELQSIKEDHHASMILSGQLASPGGSLFLMLTSGTRGAGAVAGDVDHWS